MGSHGLKADAPSFKSNLDVLNRLPQRDLAFFALGRNDEVILQLHVLVGGRAQLSPFAHSEEVCSGQSEFHPCHMPAKEFGQRRGHNLKYKGTVEMTRTGLGRYKRLRQMHRM